MLGITRYNVLTMAEKHVPTLHSIAVNAYLYIYVFIRNNILQQFHSAKAERIEYGFEEIGIKKYWDIR